MGSDQRRVFLAVVLSGVVLVVWQTFFAPKVSVEEKMKAYKQEEKVFHQENVNSNKDLPAKSLKFLFLTLCEPCLTGITAFTNYSLFLNCSISFYHLLKVNLM